LNLLDFYFLFQTTNVFASLLSVTVTSLSYIFDKYNLITLSVKKNLSISVVWKVNLFASKK